MARKKQEIALQLEINTQEEWDELMKKEGLLVVDVYQDWCGPCKAVINFFRRIKNEIGDDFLNFAVAKADSIDSLEKYRGKCEPCFLIYGGRSLVGVIRGANPPVLETTIKLKLEEEHKVMKGEMERNETKDPFLADTEGDDKVQEVDKEVEEIEREVTLALIKPDVVKAGKVEEIIAKLQEAGIEILAQQERNLTVEEAKEFYHHMADSEYFEDLIKFISSGPSQILVLAKGDQGVIHEFRELIGPKVWDEAKEKAPNSIRAVYGTTSIENAIHGADDNANAQRELAFFFPDFMVPKISRKKHEESNVQRTLALIRPAAFVEYKDNILEKINASGFKIVMQKEVQLNKEDAALFYKVHKDKPFFEELITEMSKGTLLVLALEKQNAVQGWRGMLGPKDVEKAKEVDPSSLRAQFSKDDVKINLLHGSDSDETAMQELKYFFPVEQTIAAIKPDGMENEEEIINKIEDAKFKIIRSKRVEMDQQFAEDFYTDQAHQEYFSDLISHMQSGSTLFMILSREDAIRGWRSLIGPKDPQTAEETYPDSIRAIYGRDIKKNAVYGSENPDEVNRVMKMVFGHLEFNEEGELLPEFMEKSDETDAPHEVVVEEQHGTLGESEEKHLESQMDSQAETRVELDKEPHGKSPKPELSNDKEMHDMEEKPETVHEKPETVHEKPETVHEKPETVHEKQKMEQEKQETDEVNTSVTETSKHETDMNEESESKVAGETTESVNQTMTGEETENVNESQEMEVKSMEHTAESHQETVMEKNEMTEVEEPSITDTKADVTVADDTAVSESREMTEKSNVEVEQTEVGNSQHESEKQKESKVEDKMDSEEHHSDTVVGNSEEHKSSDRLVPATEHNENSEVEKEEKVVTEMTEDNKDSTASEPVQ